MNSNFVLSVVAAGLLATAPAALAQTPAPAAPKAQEAAKNMVFMAGSRSFLGVGVVEVTSERTKALKLSEERGVEITKVDEASPAEKAGLKVGDVVTEYNGQRVEGTEQFVRFVRETPPGRIVKLTVVRNGNSQVLAATIDSRKGQNVTEFMTLPKMVDMPEMPRVFIGVRSGALGIEAEPVGPQLAEFFGVKQGVLVRSVNKGSAAERAGIKAGDVIVKADDRAVNTAADVTHAIAASKDKNVSLTLMRERKELTIAVKVDETASPRSRAAQRF